MRVILMGMQFFMGIRKKIKTTALALLLIYSAKINAADLGPQSSHKQMLAKMYAIQAASVIQVGDDQEIQQHQYTLAGFLYNKAISLTPNNPQLWRLKLELAQIQKDHNAQILAMRKIIKLDPKDDVIQLALIRKIINTNNQTAENRISALAQIFNSPSGKKLTPPLRSRIASDIAKYANELGNRNQVKTWLKAALKLDPITNRDALELIYALVKTNSKSQPVIAKAFLNLIKADPLNPQYRDQLAAILISQKAYVQAADQYVLQSVLTQAPLPSANEVYSVTHALACSGKLNAAMLGLNSYHQALMQKALNQAYLKANQAAKENNQPFDLTAFNQKKQAIVDQVKLPIPLQLIRIVLVHAGQQHIQNEQPIKDLVAQYQKQIIAEPQNAQSDQRDLAWLVCFYSKEHQSLSKLIADVQRQEKSNPGLLACLQGWSLIAKKQYPDAKKRLTPYASTLPFATLGLAEIEKQNKNNPKYFQLLQTAIDQDPAALSAITAATQLIKNDKKVKISSLGQTYNRLIAKWPSIINQPKGKRQQITLRLKPKSSTYQYLESHQVQIKIRNNSSLPLSLGQENATLSKQLWIFLQGQNFPAAARIVVNAGRRLVLKPYDTLEFTVPLDWNTIGQYDAALAAAPFEYRGEAIFAPHILPNGAPVVGLLGAKTHLQLIGKQVIKPTQANITDMINQLESQDKAQQYTALAWLGRILPQVTPQEEIKPDAPQAAAQVQQREIFKTAGQKFLAIYKNADPDTQTWIAATIRFAQPDPASDTQTPRKSYLAEVCQLVAQNQNQHQRIMYLLQQIQDPQDPIFNQTMRSGNKKLIQMTQWIQDIFKQRKAARDKIKAMQEANPKTPS